jgi:signal transduction histidine kinase
MNKMLENLITEFIQNNGVVSDKEQIAYLTSYLIEKLNELDFISKMITNNYHAVLIENEKLKLSLNNKDKDISLLKLECLKIKNAIDKTEQQKKELARLNQSKDIILNIVSHDLNNILSSIVGTIDMLSTELQPESKDHLIQIIRNSSNRAIKLVKDLLEANRVEMPDYQIETEAYNINEIIQSYHDLYINLLNDKQINVTYRLSETPLYCMINPDKFWQIIFNLITNAVKFSHPNTCIEISSQLIQKNGKDLAQIIIADQGIGIPGELVPKIFDKFSKAGRRGTHGEASNGLGLFIVKKLLTLHHGHIAVKSIENQGTQFIISLPLSYTRCTSFS